MTNDSYDEVDRYLGRLFASFGLAPDGVDAEIEYGERPAWAVYYRGTDCKVQVCWSAREGGIDFMLAPSQAPNELGLQNSSKQWRFMLLLSDFNDGLETPKLDDDAATWWDWRKSLFKIHYPVAHAALLRLEAT